MRVPALLLAGLLLAGCSGSDPASPAGSGSAPQSGSASASASASPSSTLTAEQQQAFEEATQTVMAYRQLIVDLYSGARTDLNDLHKVATGDLLDQNLRNIQEGLNEGRRAEPAGVQLALVSSEPVTVKDDNTKVVLRACIDATEVTDFDPSGTAIRGKRELLTYTTEKTPHLSSAVWKVSRVQGDTDEADRSC